MKAASREYVERLEAQDRSDQQIDQILASKGLERPPSYSAGLIRNALGEGLALGFGDEIEAGVRSAFSDDSYENIRDELRQDQQAWQKDNPLMALASELGGGLVTGIAGGAKFLGKKALQHGGPALGRMAGLGAAEGAASGLGHSQADLMSGDAALDTAVGAGLGGAVGGAAYPVARAFQSVANRGPGGRAEKKLRQVLQSEGVDNPATAMQQLDETGGGVIADMPGVGQHFNGYAVQPGAGRTTAYDFMNDRQTDLRKRLMEFSENQTGIKGTPTEYLKELEANRIANAHRTYGPIMKKPVNASEPILRSIDSKAGSSAFRDASDKYYMETGERILKEDAADVTDLKFWNYYQSHLFGAQKSKKDKTKSMRIREMREEVNNSLDSQVPEFKEARRTYAMALRNEEAVEHGRKVITDRKIHPKDVENDVAAMNPQERRSFLKGIMSAVEDRSLSMPETADTASNILRRPGTRDKIIAGFGQDAKKADNFIARLKQFSKQGETASNLLHGSRTAPLEASINASKQAVDLGADVAQNGMSGLYNQMIKSGKQFFQPGVDQAGNKMIVDAMLKGGDEGKEMLQRVFQGGNLNPQITGGLVSPAIGLGGYGGEQ